MKKIWIVVIILLILALAFLFFNYKNYFSEEDSDKNISGKIIKDKDGSGEEGSESEGDLIDVSGSGGGSSSSGRSGGGSAGSGSSSTSGGDGLPGDINTAPCGIYFERYGVCSGSCPLGECIEEGESCYCRID